MNKFSLFDRVLFRVAKQHNLFLPLTKYYNAHNTMLIVKELDVNEPISIDKILDYNKDVLYIVRHNRFELSFYNILYNLVKANLNDFLTENGLTDKLINGIMNYNLPKPYSAYTLNIETLDDYLNNLEKYKVSPFNVFLYVFGWKTSKEGYDFWSEIHTKYKAFYLKILFNEYL